MKSGAPAQTSTTRRNILRGAGVASAAALLHGYQLPAALAQPPGQPGTATGPFVPVPVRARPPKIPPKGYLLDQLGDGLYGIRDGIDQAMFLVSRKGVAAIDAPERLGEKMLAAIAEITTRPVTHVIYSHAHVDHIGAAHLFPPTAAYIAHERTAELLRRANDPRRPVPTKTFDGNHSSLKIGEHQLFLDYHGTNHLPGNLFIHAPQHRLLSLVDVIIPRWIPFFRLDTARDIPGFVEAIDKSLEYDFDTFFGGHMGWYGTREDVVETQEWTADLKRVSAEAVRTVGYEDAIKGVDPDNGYAQLGAYFNALVDTSAKLMPTKWLTLLAGADVFLRDNCSAMTLSLLND
ncbi:MBL fold metallo-hydrolase [Amycolatopsis nigrescens]|uniref:MBL fold metallo-hydrolase n=1 Tax=Amycolatopsis nigrescens TaxID=381445 RepID=UPI001FDEF744|nr:MBL fold metallo-hydrolase [Amycolatopsis nigrescens]